MLIGEMISVDVWWNTNREDFCSLLIDAERRRSGHTTGCAISKAFINIPNLVRHYILSYMS